MPTKFCVIANVLSFNGMGDCPGKVIASPDAVYLVPGAGDLDAKASMSVPPIGPLGVATAIARRQANDFADRYRAEFHKDMTDLEPLVSGEADWPIRTDVQGIILRREEVTSMRYPWWGALKIVAGDCEAVIKPAFFNRGRVLATLREAGWTI